MDIKIFEQLPLLAILRGIDSGMISPIAEIAEKAGLKALEITMNTENASRLIGEMSKTCSEKISVGAGTVLTLDDAKQAHEAGATFIVTPCVNVEVIEYCVSHSLPVFPGALTPTEVYTAWTSGATMVKIFPASVFGPKYFRELHGPLDKAKLLACGGVNADNVAEYFSNGASAVAFGSSIFDLKNLRNKNYEVIGTKLQKLVSAYLNYIN